MVILDMVPEEVVAHLWLHLQPFRSQHLHERPGKYAPTLYAYN
jgi:hypothetical protein